MLCFNEAGQELRCADIAEDGGENAVVGDCGQLKRHGNAEEPCDAGGGGREESEDSGALLMKHMNTAGEDAAAFEVDSTAVVVRSRRAMHFVTVFVRVLRKKKFPEGWR